MDYLYKDTLIELDDLLNVIYEMSENNYRLVQICCTSLTDHYELNYSFGKGYDFINYKMNVALEDEIPSISTVFKPAFLYENEMKDLFGLKIKYVTMDYNGHLYDLKVKTPYKINEKEGEEHE